MKIKEKILSTSKGSQKDAFRFPTVRLSFTKLNRKFLAFVEKRITKRQKAYSKCFYQNIHEISLYNFLQCYINNDFYYLYKKQPKKRIELFEVEHFANLTLEFTEAMSGSSITEFSDLIKFYTLLGKVRILEAAGGMVEMLSEKTKKILKRIGVSLTDDNKKNVLIISGMLSKLTRELNMLSDKLQTQQNENEKSKNFKTYEDILAALGAWFKYHFTLEISVASFCSNYNIYKKQIQEQWRRNQSTQL